MVISALLGRRSRRRTEISELEMKLREVGIEPREVLPIGYDQETGKKKRWLEGCSYIRKDGELIGASGVYAEQLKPDYGGRNLNGQSGHGKIRRMSFEYPIVIPKGSRLSAE